ncbi:hypothetical protein CEXT_102981 [Caerostris extrusa]|uniref:Uncharacterized protein n=1 Tax=Caerostris extrusa TaxID=172846 RepID=A0AAV4QWE6_CAEEX|nr:hypothetical protein CEXT_102981 [Caerostris extrusa]
MLDAYNAEQKLPRIYFVYKSSIPICCSTLDSRTMRAATSPTFAEIYYCNSVAKSSTKMGQMIIVNNRTWSRQIYFLPTFLTYFVFSVIDLVERVGSKVKNICKTFSKCVMFFRYLMETAREDKNKNHKP